MELEGAGRRWQEEGAGSQRAPTPPAEKSAGKQGRGAGRDRDKGAVPGRVPGWQGSGENNGRNPFSMCCSRQPEKGPFLGLWPSDIQASLYFTSKRPWEKGMAAAHGPDLLPCCVLSNPQTPSAALSRTRFPGGTLETSLSPA